FDLVTFGAVLEHLYEPAFALERAVKWLKPDGLLHCEVPSSDWLMATLARIYYRVIGSRFVANLSPMHRPFHLYEFTAESFRRHGARAGYRVAEARIEVCSTRLPKALRWADPPLRAAMAATNTGMQLVVWMTPTTSQPGPPGFETT